MILILRSLTEFKLKVKMNVKKNNIFGKEIIIQDKELVAPTIFQIRGIIREPYW